MWKAAAGHQISVGSANGNDDDDWETDPDFVVSRDPVVRFGARVSDIPHNMIFCHFVSLYPLYGCPIKQTW